MDCPWIAVGTALLGLGGGLLLGAWGARVRLRLRCLAFGLLVGGVRRRALPPRLYWHVPCDTRWTAPPPPPPDPLP